MSKGAKVPVETRKAVLEARLIELGERLEAIDEELSAHNDPDWEELAVEREGDEVLEATGNVGAVEIARIRSALARITDGSYGLCARCGDPISEARLDAIPWTPFCRSCAQ
jgi:RNA polymerase-binding transcription factor DksA